jgi:hypothetical protein
MASNLPDSYISIYMYIIPLLKNIYLTTTDLLLILNGKPDNTILLAIILSGFTECNEPVATKLRVRTLLRQGILDTTLYDQVCP